MTVTALVADLRARGITLVPDGDLLHLRPSSALTARDIEVLRSRKAEVLAVLRAELRQDPTRRLVCFACKSTHLWRSIHGVTVCGSCHPPARPDLVARWLDAPGEVRRDG